MCDSLYWLERRNRSIGSEKLKKEFDNLMQPKWNLFWILYCQQRWNLQLDAWTVLNQLSRKESLFVLSLNPYRMLFSTSSSCSKRYLLWDDCYIIFLDGFWCLFRWCETTCTTGRWWLGVDFMVATRRFQCSRAVIARWAFQCKSISMHKKLAELRLRLKRTYSSITYVKKHLLKHYLC